ncbi:MAG: MBL fold metallo-hydrolase [Candidatus Nanohalobium sp.]
MKLTFLGTCGGRYATGLQTRQTGGIVLETEETQIHIDPGPGALVHSHSTLKEPLETETAIVSHGHPDHYSDAEAIIEMMVEASDKPGALFAPESVLSGYGEIEKSVSDHHQDLCMTVKQLEDGSSFEFKDLKIESQEMFHSDPKTQGFKISDGEKTFGFWTDTEYSEELVEFYQGCDTLVVYCTRPKGRGVRSHTGISDVPEIAEETGVDNIILTHFGQALLNSDMEEQKEWLKEETEAKVTFAEDGMEYPGNRSLGDF